GAVGFSDLRFLVKHLIGTSFGDSNLDLVFDSSDLLAVFQVAEYEDDIQGNSTWADGDWDGDGDFGTSDLVLAFQDAGFVQAAQGSQASGTIQEKTNQSPKWLHDVALSLLTYDLHDITRENKR
ncbi:MAG: hypothetical protein KDB27_36555, partial [Planctomycetales bacterium]|nr:hypothetical protein [Planctomycetales bacterium]